MESARVLIEVVAGLLPGEPMPEFTHRWGITSAQWEKIQAGDRDALDQWDKVHGWAREYAARLMNPQSVNWVRLDVDQPVSAPAAAPPAN